MPEELDEVPLKKIFDCEGLADKEVDKFQDWFKDTYGKSHEEARDSEIVKGIYAYTKMQRESYQPTEGEGFKILTWKDVGKNKSRRFFRKRKKANLKDFLEEREGNCVAFTSLFCMLAEETGVSDVSPFMVRRLEDGRRLPEGHVTPLFEKDGKRIVFDPHQMKSNPDYEGEKVGKSELKAFALNHEGNKLRSEGKYDEAMKKYDKALEIKPDFAAVVHNKGMQLKEIGKYDEALEKLDKALEMDPDDWMTNENKRYVQRLKEEEEN